MAKSDTGTIRVLETRDRGVYHTESWSQPALFHRVDLFSKKYPGNGECDCHHFRIHCHKNWIRNGGRVVPYHLDGNTQCRHIEVSQRKCIRRYMEIGADMEGEGI